MVKAYFAIGLTRHCVDLLIKLLFHESYKPANAEAIQYLAHPPLNCMYGAEEWLRRPVRLCTPARAPV